MNTQQRMINDDTMQADLWGGAHSVYIGDAQYEIAEPVASDAQVASPVESVEQVSEVDPAQQDFFAGSHNSYVAPVLAFGGGVNVVGSTWSGKSEGILEKLIRAIKEAARAIIPDA